MAPKPNPTLLALTAGEPAGIGPELCLALAGTPWAERTVIITDPDVLRARAALLGRKVTLVTHDGQRRAELPNGSVTVNGTRIDVDTARVVSRATPTRVPAAIVAWVFATTPELPDATETTSPPVTASPGTRTRSMGSSVGTCLTPHPAASATNAATVGTVVPEVPMSPPSGSANTIPSSNRPPIVAATTPRMTQPICV